MSTAYDGSGEVLVASLPSRTARVRAILTVCMTVATVGVSAQALLNSTLSSVGTSPAPAARLLFRPVTPLIPDATTRSSASRDRASLRDPLRESMVLASSDSLSKTLSRVDGVMDEDVRGVMTALRGVLNARRLQAGQEVIAHFEAVGASRRLTGVQLALEQDNAMRLVTITRSDKGKFDAQKVDRPYDQRRFAADAVIGTTLFDAGRAAGVPDSVMATFIRVYSHEVDFQRDIRPGDRFEIMYDQPVTPDGRKVGSPDIAYASLTLGDKVLPIYRMTLADGRRDYFSPDGRSFRRTLMRTPVDGGYITSTFGMRNHPILGFSRMHKGVDFGAPVGSPIYAAGHGVIEEIGPKGAYGRYVRLRHGEGVQTAYAHMSRFAQGLKVGAKVEQGETIGYVGSSGRSTGPHLHYEVLMDGVQMNPLKLNMASGTVLRGRDLAEFNELRTLLQREFAHLRHSVEGVILARGETLTQEARNRRNQEL
ncbi:MAG: M23 family metallopeptidase [Alphaproteobacteria bacterium]|nr:MAG: M23 family metallopeptidase [Alphaproteobacteria bacterium]